MKNLDKKIILFNGAVKSGKDTITRYLCNKYLNCHHQEFKAKLFELTRAIYCIDKDDWEDHYTTELKEQPWDKLNGLSPRQALIEVSEKVIKPYYGDDYFGNAAARSLKPGYNIFSDSGFMSELVPLINVVGEENILFIRIYREGCDYTGDSRSYLYPEKIYTNIKTYDVCNNGTKEELTECVYDILEHVDWIV